MTNYFRPMSPFAMAICIAVMTWAATWPATPAAAVEDSAPVSATKAPSAKSSDIKTSPSVIRHHASRRTHFAVSRHNRRASLLGTSPVCSGVWCGRQFVLMVGIGF